MRKKWRKIRTEKMTVGDRGRVGREGGRRRRKKMRRKRRCRKMRRRRKRGKIFFLVSQLVL